MFFTTLPPLLSYHEFLWFSKDDSTGYSEEAYKRRVGKTILKSASYICMFMFNTALSGTSECVK